MKSKMAFKMLLLLQLINILYSEIDHIKRLGNETFRYFQFSSNSNGDMIIDISSDVAENKQRIFFGLKRNGRFYFYENGKETPFRTFISTLSRAKMISESLFIQLSTDDDNNGKEYLFSMSTGSSNVELYDIESENGIVSGELSLTFLNNKFSYSIISSIFKSKLPDSKYYYIFARTINSSPQNPIYIIKDYFDSSTLSTIRLTYLKSQECTNNNVVSCFETSQFRIICLYQNSDYNLEIYSFSDTTYSGELSNILYSAGFAENLEIFFKCIHLKEEIGVFMYYKNTDSSYPTISIRKYIESSGMLPLDNNFENVDLIDFPFFSSGITLNDIIKINDDKICIASTPSSRTILVLVILNLFENDTKMLICYYNINLMDLNYKIFKDIKLFLYNDYISFGFSHYLSSICEESDPYYSSLIIFNYPTSTDSNLDLLQYLSENNNDISSLNINLSENCTINNKIFG